ncbi:unnamed protein product [Lepeophtheirus salmonis]|uniref:(salmon louse) hypothetical protein n=1 Tax=Lepeophtheirus salmonis TaxID=72036 RepID=A0A7R8CQB4_LEPSM|nr:unnamed protein product [Lepeophtheirus salmonis]CAF2858087.1 unnamed protein product [Lepeophtheirus salmonis]
MRITTRHQALKNIIGLMSCRIEMFITPYGDTPGGGSNKVKPLLYAKADWEQLLISILSIFSGQNKDIITNLASQGLAPISAEQGLTVSHQIQAVLYIETSAKSSHRAALSAFENRSHFPSIPCTTSSSQIKKHSLSSCTSKASCATSRLLGPPKQRKPLLSRTFINKSLLHLHQVSESNSQQQPFKVVSRERSLLNLSGATPRTPKTQRKERERMVTIKCQRLTLDKRREEVDVEVPAPIYETLRFYNVSSDDLLRDCKNDAPKSH